MMWKIAVGALAALAFGSSAPAAAADPSGSWVIHAEGRTASVITLKRQDGGWIADWEQPGGIKLSTSHMLAPTDRPPEHKSLRSAGGDGGAIDFRYVAPAPADENDILTFTQLAGGLATLGYKGAPFEPILLVRGRPGEKLSTGWEAGREYRIDEPWPSNAEMKRLFDEDQAARAAPAKIDWSVVGPEDEARRAATRKLLDAGALHSGDDYWRAAFVFQHGSKPEDFLLAHSLAIIAAAKGRRDATWIAAATLDRYLQTIGQKQVYGTQFRFPPGGAGTQEPYDPSIVSDALRTATGVPTLAGQREQMKAMAARYGVPAGK